MPNRRPSWVRLAMLVGGIGLLTLLAHRLGPARILSLLWSLGANIFVIAFLFGAHECVRALAVGVCLPTDQRPAFRSLLRIRFVGEAVGALTRTGPFGAEPLRAWMLAGQGGPGPQAYAAAVSELIANSCTSAAVTVVVAAMAIPAFHLHRPLLVVCHVLLWSSLLYICVVVGVLAARAQLIGAALRGLGRLPILLRRMQIDPERVRATQDAVVHSFVGRPRVLATVMWLECVAQAILVTEIYWTIRSMGVSASPTAALLVEVLTKAANVVQFVGVREAGYAVALDWLGLTAAAGFTLSLVKLLRSLITAGLGLAILKGLDRRDSAPVGAPA
jgi:hypothetical protein